MNNDFKNPEYSKTNKDLKDENDRLYLQNSKLIKKLEEITLEFSKSQTKIREIELMEVNQKGVSGNLNKLLDQIKILESDNRKLCKELKKELNKEPLNDVIVKEVDLTNISKLSDKKCSDSKSQEQIISLKNHIRELQKQLVKTQKIAFENECNFKECQIETLEAFKYCEIEKYSLGNKICDLEEAAKNMLSLHQENLDLKTSLTNYNTEMKLTKNNFTKLTEKLTKSETHVTELENKMKCLETKYEESQIKSNELSQENQCLLNTLEELTSSKEKYSEKNCEEKCDECKQKSVLLDSYQENMRKIEVEFKRVNKEKEELNKQYEDQMKLVSQFEIEQIKLRTDLNNLSKSSSTFESLVKSKDGEIDNLGCQLSSVQQRLELRDQRLNEVSNKLTKSLSDEKCLSLKYNQLLEKVKKIEKELYSYQKQLEQSVKDNEVISEKLEQHQNIESKSNEKIKNLKFNLKQKDNMYDEVKASLESTKCTLNTTSQEFISRISSLNEKVDQLTYSVKIFEEENQKLEENFKVAQDEIKTLKNDDFLKTEAHKTTQDKLQLQLGKDAEIIHNQESDIKMMTSEIENFKSFKNEMEKVLSEKNTENESLILQQKIMENQFKDMKQELSKILKEKEQWKQDSYSNQQLKMELNNKNKENKKLKHDITELNLKLDVINQSMLDEKEKNGIEECKYRDMSTQLLTLQFKFSYVEEELHNKRIQIKNLEDAQNIKLKSGIDKLHSVEKERDDAYTKIRAIEEYMEKFQKECLLFKNQNVELQKVIVSQKEELLSQGHLILNFEKDICKLNDYIKCNQQTLVERSRDIDRLEQLVRDRTQQVEVRSTQLQEFEFDLENKLTEIQTELKNSNIREEQQCVEIERIKKINDEMVDKYNTMEKTLKEKLLIIKNKENEICDVSKQNDEFVNEKSKLLKDFKLLKEELTSKSLVIKDLLKQIRTKNNDLEKIQETLNSKMSALYAKELQIRQTEEQSKQYRKLFTEVEIKLKTELKSTLRKLESFEIEERKSKEKIKIAHNLELKKYQDELHKKSERIECLMKDIREISDKFLQSQDDLANVKFDLQTHKSVLIDTENNCRLKEVVIERLLKKLNMDSLQSYSIEMKDLKAPNELKHISTKNENNFTDIYQDISLQELINRITNKLDENPKLSTE